jgi:rhamnulose-1-phosphate aldolase/alcohol dehydrogenase
VTSSPAAAPLAQLVARSRRLGADRSLVVYGGGNTSAKGTATDAEGIERDVMWVKASGFDMRTADESGYPAVLLEPLLELRGERVMTDEEMTERLRLAMLDDTANRPSIETLMHAFLPFRHVDHVHADSVCALTNHKDGRRVVREALGENWGYVDWMRTGFPLSAVVGGLAECEGVVLAHHGLITWADESDECYARTLAAVARAEEFVAGHRIAAGPPPRHADIPEAALPGLLLALRGALCEPRPRVLRVERGLRGIVDRADLPVLVDAGVSSADHMLRIKPRALVLEGAEPEAAVVAVAKYAADYRAYVGRNEDRMPEGFGPHDALPRVILLPGLGAITTGADVQEAAAAAEIAQHTLSVAAMVADSFGTPEPISDRETFRFDYWPLELFKLNLKPQEPMFAGHAFIVTGAASGIGRGIALDLAAKGASLVLADLDDAGLRALADLLVADGLPEPIVVAGDQSDPVIVTETVDAAVRGYGGLDGVVLNAGIGMTGTLDELTLDQWTSTMRINVSSAFLLTQAGMRAMRAQGKGGSLVYVASKNAFGPGAGFGAYSASKAAMVQLMRIAALEGGSDGIRSNAVNPDAVFDNSRLWDGGLREERAAAHGIKPEELEDFYASRNLLHRRVTTSDVAQSVSFLLSDQSSRTTGCVIPVDGGVANAFPR